ncbi:uncharacterized protein I206_102218 [Kwoniella pini CBS 10737]|uniref:Uncharacterized protein n=1 Tax=Kwoniella pini CBS 10737 TaxID=1296096 RepID=A0A1B9HSV1_9TREE|nr:uncharacterized protein I206_07586 [Kwoniella pini CBS 10737]OCF46353.1 hypothetical protein I206_07586 [Kwoniella pini CBS 10737]
MKTADTQSTLSPRLSQSSKNARSSSSKSLQKVPSHITLPFKGSFANLTKLIGLSSVSPKEGDEEEDEEEITDGDDIEEGEVDEESLMWDAQAALIAHHPDLAIKLYTQAALPPFCSPAACLALGNLLIRGSTLTETESPNQLSSDMKGKQRATSTSSIETQTDTSGYSTFGTISSKIFSKFFGNDSTSYSISTSGSHVPVPIRRPTVDLVASGWQIPKEGKRAIRDPHSMGVAGAWFVLGLSWLVETEIAREEEKSKRRPARAFKVIPVDVLNPEVSSNGKDETACEDEILSFDPKTKVKRAIPQTKVGSLIGNTAHHNDLEESDILLSDSVDTICPPKSNPSSSSGRTLESPMIRTPGDALTDDPFNAEIQDTAKDLEVLQTMYDLLQPLLSLYRHGHIQSQDPVALPPITLQTLPSILRPRTETEKRRNVWRLGQVVASKISVMKLLKQDEKEIHKDSKEIERLKGGVDIITNYILAMTASEVEAEMFFRRVIANRPTGFDAADDLIRQAAKRLDIITSTPREEDNLKHFPFPTVSNSSPATHLSPPRQPFIPLSPPKPSSRRSSSTRHGRQASTASVASISASQILPTTLKSCASAASLCSFFDGTPESATIQLSDTHCAMSTLKRFHKQSEADLTKLQIHDLGERAEPIYPSLNGWNLSPPVSESTTSPFGVSHASQRTIIASRESGPRLITGSNPNKHIGISPTNTLRAVSSSPQLHTLEFSSNTEKPAFGSTTDLQARRKLPFEPTSDQAINPIDPELARAELSSALTKHVMCGVCGMQGVNFPECRKCGLTFCSRECRVGENKAGNGKKHICGLWESKKVLSAGLSNTDLHIPLVPDNGGVLPVMAATVY